MKNNTISENEFFPGPGGSAGAITYQAPYGTHSSPDIAPNRNQVFNSKHNTSPIGANSNTAALNNSGSFDKDINDLYSKKITPSPDEIRAGLTYELGKQIKKDKAKAKEYVLSNLKQNPKYYSSLSMLDITDDAMTQHIKENKTAILSKILNKMAMENNKKIPVNPRISNIISNMKSERKKHYSTGFPA